MYSSLGVRRVVNACGIYTDLGAMAVGDALVLCTEALRRGDVEGIGDALPAIWSILDDG